MPAASSKQTSSIPVHSNPKPSAPKSKSKSTIQGSSSTKPPVLKPLPTDDSKSYILRFYMHLIHNKISNSAYSGYGK